MNFTQSCETLVKLYLIYNERLWCYTLLLFSISVLPLRASSGALMWVKALTTEESPFSLQQPHWDHKSLSCSSLTWKVNTLLIQFTCTAQKCQALKVEHCVRFRLKPPLITNITRLHLAAAVITGYRDTIILKKIMIFYQNQCSFTAPV